RADNGRMHQPGRLGTAIVLSAGLLALRCAGGVGGAAPETAHVETASPSPSASPAPDRAAFVAAVDVLAADALERGPIAGLSIAVFEHGQAVLAKGYGFADVDAKVPAGPETS